MTSVEWRLLLVAMVTTMTSLRPSLQTEAGGSTDAPSSDGGADDTRVDGASEHQTARSRMERKGGFWYEEAVSRLQRELGTRENRATARNAILFLGDGMSLTTVTAARIYLGQLSRGNSGEEASLHFENLPYSGLAKTYCVDRQVADSACSATALLCGVKNRMGTVGVTGDVSRGDCASVNASTSVPSVMYWAQLAGKSTGIVTTTRVTHASPAAAYAHSADRSWEAETRSGCDHAGDIARQLVHDRPGSQFNVILGGGRRNFYSKSRADEEGVRGRRKDGRDLVEEWRVRRSGSRHRYVHSRQQLLRLDYNATDYLLGLFSPSHLDYHLDAEGGEQPSLEEMTEAAIRILSTNPRGFLLFVESGRIDHGHHETKAVKALDETVELSKAVARSRQLVDEAETLVVVTADHGHTLTMSGYPPRGSSIAGRAGTALDYRPYSTLSYANGPPSSRSKADEKGRGEATTDERFPSMVALKRETHGGEDVPVYSSGPWAHLLKGTFEQNYIALVLMYASCVGPLPTACRHSPPRSDV